MAAAMLGDSQGLHVAVGRLWWWQARGLRLGLAAGG